jgi:cation diffusion facilitator family transporter
MLTIAARPRIESHTYRHARPSIFERARGALIVVAAAAILWTAIYRLISPQPLEQIGLGIVVSVVASVINFAVARTLMKAGREYNSITLEADAYHLMTDVWTSIAVIAGVGVVALTGWLRLDPIIAIAVAINIIWTGVRLVRRSVAGLMDASLPPGEREEIEAVMARYREKNVDFHALRTRQAGARRFVTLHMLVPGEWTVHDAHHVAEDFEGDVRAVLGDAVVNRTWSPLKTKSQWKTFTRFGQAERAV